MSDQITPPGAQPGPPATPPQPYPQPQGTAYPTGPVPGGQYWAPPQPPLPPHGIQAPARRGNGLAITAVVLSALALLVAVGIGAFIAIGVAAGPGPSALTGRVTPVDKGVAGAELQGELSTIITNDGGSVDTITCPERSQVAQGLVTVCKGSVDGGDWTGVVVFEDDGGTFVLDEL